MVGRDASRNAPPDENKRTCDECGHQMRLHSIDKYKPPTFVRCHSQGCRCVGATIDNAPISQGRDFPTDALWPDSVTSGERPDHLND